MSRVGGVTLTGTSGAAPIAEAWVAWVGSLSSSALGMASGMAGRVARSCGGADSVAK